MPLDHANRLRINFLGPPGTVSELSFTQLLEAARNGLPPPADRDGRPVDLDKTLVIVGATAHSLGDYHATPFANGTLPALLGARPRLMSGPELQANIFAMIPLVEDHGGMVDKYIGDGIMVIFGAPDDQPDHAMRAVEAAVAMVRRTRELGPAWARHDFPGFRIGVGVATGPALVGMVGGRRRLDYTAIGETVNIAAWIESANKELGSEVLIAARTRHAADPAVLRRLGCADNPERAFAPGIPEGLEVYRVGGPEPLVPAADVSSGRPTTLVPDKDL